MAWATATGEQVDRALQTLENFTAWRDDSERRGRAGIDRAARAARRQDPRSWPRPGPGRSDAHSWRPPSRPDAWSPGDDAILIDFEGEPAQTACGAAAQGQSAARRRRPAALVRLRRRDDETRAWRRRVCRPRPPRRICCEHFVAVARPVFLEGYRRAQRRPSTNGFPTCGPRRRCSISS